ncbi:hypothetical protein CHLNCDRAFT_145120 [Chlorella variabilis]|uniref:Glycosyl transferase family 1 domain-containing protein n=1 Tax=Chlorella variabilis TaxID=554065 RepID=E1ZCM2_CHLVA|nr:hypothetical protein CHLNCDRAFT_145120 [Chlorella variabilis]EFN56266.1 hypothetical protein CHLNCDRAFT_145120 [Chlorella variabilis]|eukprot:XP_005848368.1 hypothetical protein CHLNCDRAFT_145120 [Chlorella variabilis]
MFWSLPRAAVGGILNGMEESQRPAAADGAAADPDAFFAKKHAAKLAFQQAKGLAVGEENRLLVFMGRITHQKGCDIIAMAARSILKGSRVAQIAMVGPIGDEYGEQAKHMLEKVSQAFPGRVWNGAGLYAMGAEKEQLCMAADFFLCPSRFEPCGLADIEFGWLGAVMIGHNTGGLGKMPGVYYTAELDCTEDQSIRLALTALKALALPEEELRRLGTEAIKADFPPSRMIRAYDKRWRRLHACALTAATGEAGMAPGEGEFYAEQALDRTMSVVAVTAVIGSEGTTNITGFQVAGIILLVIAVWLALWLLRPHSLSPHFEHRRLRLHGQLSMLFKQRHHWMLAVTTTTLDTASVGYCLSIVWDVDQGDAQWFALANALTSMVAIGALGAFLTTKPGRRLGLKLMWAIAATPCVTLAQVALIKYGGSAATWVAATVVAALHVRTNMVGLLNLHTSVEVWVVTGTYEALRVLLVAGMVALHRRENIAKP